MPDLYPTFEAPEVVEVPTEAAPEYPKAPLFDFVQGDFVMDGAGRVVMADGHRAWVQWCIKTVLTERFAYAIYGPDYGTELQEAKKQPDRAAVEVWIEREITEALLIDPRTEMVQDFTFNWRGDELTVGFTVVPVVGTPEHVEVTIGG